MFKYPWGITEDSLTGDFFGLMKYLPNDALLQPFLVMMQNMYPDRDIIPDHIESAELDLWPDYEVPRAWSNQFNRPDVPAERKLSKYYIVPDAVLRIDDRVFVVEAERSHSVEAEQLFQQYLIAHKQFVYQKEPAHNLFIVLLNTDQMPAYSCHINFVDEETGITISSTDSIPQYIQKRAKMLGESHEINEISRSFLWISWHHIGRLAEEVLDSHEGSRDERSRIISKFLSGLKGMMDRERFYPVSIFRADDLNEVRVDNSVSIPVLKILPDWEGFSPSFVEAIDPFSIPTLKLLPGLANWLAKCRIQPESIRVLNKGGN